jgi:anthranilate synthase component 2
MIFVVDNYDSFTWNLVQYVAEIDPDVEVARNDAFDVDELLGSIRPKRIVVSPGPGTPARAGRTLELIRKDRDIPLFGVCLGLQAIGEAFGGKVVRAPVLMHGKTSSISHDGRGLFRGLPSPFTATRYHSLVVREDSIPPELEISAVTGDGTEGSPRLVMGLRHRSLPIEGVQFHPESILTEHGREMIRNFLEERPR